MDNETVPSLQSKEFLENLGKRSECYLKLSYTAIKGASYPSGYMVTDDVGCPVANVASFTIEAKSGEVPKLVLVINNLSFDIIT